VEPDGTILIWDLEELTHPVKHSPSVRFTAAELETLWGELAHEDPGRAYRAIGRFADAAGQAVSFFRERMNAEARRKHPPFSLLLAQLDDERFAVRQQATRALTDLGEEIRPLLLAALKERPTVEVRLRVEEILAHLDGPLAPGPLRRRRTVLALEEIGTPDARRLLETLAQGDSLPMTAHQAKAALARLAGSTSRGLPLLLP
jgi:hypothetical protein